MKLCLLFLSVLTLFHLHSRHITSAAEGVWLPNLDKLSFIIHICEHELAFKRPRPLPIVIPIKPKKIENVKINSRISVKSDKSNGPAVVSLANVDVDLNKNAVSVSHSVDVDKNRDELLIPALRARKGFGRKPKGPIKIRPTFELPWDGLFRSSMARSPPDSPVSNVVTVNNANKQDDALKGLGFRSQAADKGRRLRRIYVQKVKYRNIAQCVKARLAKAYEEEISFYD